jgi:antitoxin component of RelBE/YafQ-DinJ toxin-antitoxin module
MASRDLQVKAVRLDRDALKTTRALEKKLGLAFSSIVRLALRRLAEQEGIKAA